jgi:hypothetical protein
MPSALPPYASAMSEQENTVTYVRHLRPYPPPPGGHNVDPYVEECLPFVVPDQATRDKLYEYTRGMYTRELHYASFNKYSRPLSEERHFGSILASDPSIQRAISTVRQLLHSLPPLKPIPSDRMDDIHWIPSSAAGYGYIGKKADNYPKARLNASRALHWYKRFGDEYRMVPDKAYARSQLATLSNPKIRHVWGRAFHHILIESLFGQPLIEMLLREPNPIFVGRNINKTLPAEILRLRDERPVYYCLDFKSFDSSLNSYLISVAWDIILGMFEPLDDWEKTIFSYIRRLFVHTPVIMPDGDLFIVTTGVPSGSVFTQLVDSICNLILIYALQFDLLNTNFETFVLGDDSIFTTPSPSISLNQAAIFLSRFGMTLNVEKSLITQDISEVVFLGHNFYGSRVTRDDFTVLSLALFTERPISTPHESVIRIASLLYDSGFNSFAAYNLYAYMLSKYNLQWIDQLQKPVTIDRPFLKLFYIS